MNIDACVIAGSVSTKLVSVSIFFLNKNYWHADKVGKERKRHERERTGDKEEESRSSHVKEVRKKVKKKLKVFPSREFFRVERVTEKESALATGALAITAAKTARCILLLFPRPCSAV